MYVHLGTSVLVFRNPELLFRCETTAVASELPVWVTWRDELPDRWTWCIFTIRMEHQILNPNSFGGPQNMPIVAIS